MVGDIALLEPGEIVPCDGVFLRGHNVRCDESDVTGEPGAVKKVTYEECIADLEMRSTDETPKHDCFVISGAKVLEGVGQYVVIAVGSKSFSGRGMAGMSPSPETATPSECRYSLVQACRVFPASTQAQIISQVDRETRLCC